jgi:hypothetical protein
MSAPESTKFQANFKTASGALYNVYASSTEEFISALNDMGDLVAVITSVEQALATGHTVAQHIPLAPASQQPAPVHSRHQYRYSNQFRMLHQPHQVDQCAVTVQWNGRLVVRMARTGKLGCVLHQRVPQTSVIHSGSDRP